MTALRIFDECTSDTRLIVKLGLLIPAAETALWDVSTWDSDASWSVAPDPEDVSEYVRSVNTTRKFSDDLRAWEAGSASVILDNRDGRFSPDNIDPTAPYVVAGMSGMRPGCPLYISLEHEGTEYSLFSGYITDLVEQWPGHQVFPSVCSEDPEGIERIGDALIELVATDEMGHLGRIKKRIPVSPPVGDDDTFGARVSRVLSSVGYSGGTFEQGVATLQATDLSSGVVEELTKVAESEGGLIWPDVDGVIQARGRYTLLDSTRSNTVQRYFGDNSNAAPAEIPWTGIAVAPVSDRKIINHAIYACTGGAEQEYSNPYSIALYGVCDDPSSSTDLLNKDDSQVLALAQWRVLVGSYPESIVQSIELRPRHDILTLAPVALDTKMLDLISVTLRPPSDQYHFVLRECFITGVSHSIAENDWVVTFFLSSATPYRKFDGSRWDSGLWGSSSVDPNAAIWFV